jgi:hypothetical protein
MNFMKLKLLARLAVGLALAGLTGCIVLSVYPFYTAKDLTFDPALVGNWAKAGSTNEFWRFSEMDRKSYTLLTTDSQSTNCFDAHLFRLKHCEFLDLLTTNRSEFEMPLHLISKVNLSATNVTVQFMDYDWLSRYLDTNRTALRHLVVYEKPDDTNSGAMTYLTASTRDLQVFLLKHADDTNAFSSGSTVELNRLSP